MKKSFLSLISLLWALSSYSQEIKETAFTSQIQDVGSLNPRLIGLIYGNSGVGKTVLAMQKIVGEKLGLETLILDCQNPAHAAPFQLLILKLQK